jgi:hypothetical protein
MMERPINLPETYIGRFSAKIPNYIAVFPALHKVSLGLEIPLIFFFSKFARNQPHWVPWAGFQQVSTCYVNARLHHTNKVF